MADILPNGAIQALSTAATGTLALEIAFIGYWGFGGHSGAVPWGGVNIIALIALAFAFWFLARAPYLVTDSEISKEKFSTARASYFWGVVLLGLGLLVALIGSWFCDVWSHSLICGPSM